MPIAQSKSSTHLYRRVFLVVAGLLAVTLAAVACMFFSEQFAQKAVEYFVNKNADSLGMKIEIENFTGSMASGFKFAKLTLKHRSPPLHLVALDASVKADFSKLLTGGKLSISASLAQLDLTGMAACPIAPSSIPDFNAFACFSVLPANIEIASFSLKHATIKPYQNLPLLLELNHIGLQPGEQSADHQLRAQIMASFRDKQAGSGSFSGIFKQQQNKIEGKLDLLMFGQKILSEISLSERRGRPEISGYISSTTLDISKISHWLIPIWQDAFPFGFDGIIDCNGSWFFNNEIGFFGNLSGRCRNLRMVAQGLFITLFELNGGWKLFDGHLNFVDEGSRFFGFPAALTGKVESVLRPDRKWDVDFSCVTIDFAGLADDLPWAVKYGMALPALSGGATLSVQLHGTRPEVSAKLSTDDLKAGKNHELRTVDGSIFYQLGAEGAGNLSVAMVCHSLHDLPPIFGRFKGAAGRLPAHLSHLQGPYRWQYELKGHDSAYLTLTGSLTAGAARIFNTTGNWHDGMGSIHLLLDAEAPAPKSFAASNIPLLDLLLAK